MSELLRAENLVKHFPVTSGFFGGKAGVVHAVSGVSFFLKEGETLGLVGESGCGKSTLAKLVARLIAPDSGTIIFEGKDVTRLNTKALKSFHRNLQFVFQDPYSSLNPRMTAAKIIAEPLSIHGIAGGTVLTEKVNQLLDIVGISKNARNRYPHEFSGGQRQRIGIARALALNPKLIIADEPISALDISIQAQVLNLFLRLQKEFHLTYLFISHDLRIIEYMSDRIMVMYLGKIMEIAPAKDLYFHPIHPYTQALLSDIPALGGRSSKRIILKGEIPSPINPPWGCRFHTRCIYVQDRCRNEEPPLSLRDDRLFACHFPL
ncbi:MAG: oligopeptide/dipeptide ABC transporter ATP-binding protein [Candidatus Omnitrophota bacterium]